MVYGRHETDKNRYGHWYSLDQLKPLAKLIEDGEHSGEFQGKTVHFLRQLQGKAAEGDSDETDYDTDDEYESRKHETEDKDEETGHKGFKTKETGHMGCKAKQGEHRAQEDQVQKI